MKIYIENYDVKQLMPLVSELEKCLVNENNRIILYSEDGLFEIDENNIYKINVLKDKTNSLIHDKKWKLWIDESEISRTRVHCFPLEHHFIKTQIKRYKLIKSKECDMELVIHFNEKGMSIDFYIETPNVNNFFAEHINVFLSMLN